MGPAPRMESIQMLRGIAVLMVLFFHVGVYECKASERIIFGTLLDVGKAGVDIFFVISGPLSWSAFPTDPRMVMASQGLSC